MPALSPLPLVRARSIPSSCGDVRLRAEAAVADADALLEPEHGGHQAVGHAVDVERDDADAVVQPRSGSVSP